MFPNVKGIQDLRVQSQGTKMPSSTSVKGGAKGNSTVNFQPFLLNQNACHPKNSRRSVKGTAQLDFLALHATGPHATLHVSCTPIRWSQSTSTPFGSTEEHHALSWINGKAPICHYTAWHQATAWHGGATGSKAQVGSRRPRKKGGQPLLHDPSSSFI